LETKFWQNSAGETPEHLEVRKVDKDGLIWQANYDR